MPAKRQAARARAVRSLIVLFGTGLLGAAAGSFLAVFAIGPRCVRIYSLHHKGERVTSAGVT